MSEYFPAGFEYQNNNQEIIVHSRWVIERYRAIFTNAGDIFREITSSIKIRKIYIEDIIIDIETALDVPLAWDEKWKHALKFDKERIKKLKRQWINQPTNTELHKIIVKLNLALLNNKNDKARQIMTQIKNRIKTASKKSEDFVLNGKDYGYEDILKGIYEHELGKKPLPGTRYDFIPLRERRDYVPMGHDELEEQAIYLKSKGLLPEEMENELQDRLKDFPARISNIVFNVMKETQWIKRAIDFPTEKALKKYLEEHPAAERSHHRVVETEPKPKTEVEDLKSKIEERKKEITQTPVEKPKSEQVNKLKNKIKQKKEQLNTPKLFKPEEETLPAYASMPHIKNQEDFYKSAEPAHKHMMQWLNEGKGIDKAIGAKHYTDFDEAMKALDKPGPMLITAPIKSSKRAKEKVDTDYNGDWSKLLDGTRATIAVDSFKDVNGVMGKLRESGMELARAPKDRFKKPTAGYRDILMNVKLPNGHVGELQLHLKPMLKTKQEVGHKLYEQARSISAKAKQEGRDKMNDEEEKQFQALTKAMEDTYNHVWEKVKTANIKTAKEETKYYEYKDKPAIRESKSFPVMWAFRKKKVIYDLYKFLSDSFVIDKKQYDNMMKTHGPK